MQPCELAVSQLEEVSISTEKRAGATTPVYGCGGLNENDLHRLIYLNALSPVCGTVQEGLGGVASCVTVFLLPGLTELHPLLPPGC